MIQEAWKYLDELRSGGRRIDLDAITDIILKRKIDLSKNELIIILQKGRFLGEYYTPNNVAKLMAELGRIKNPKHIVDICCGIGNILSFCDFCEEVEGIDINQSAVCLAKLINPNAKIRVGDSLKKAFKEKYDLVFGTFPFGLRVKTNDKYHFGESLFIKKALSILNKDGILVCLVPNGFLFGKSFSNIRKEISSKYNLKLIIYLPGGIIPNTSVQSSILYIENSNLKDRVYLADFKENSGEIVSKFVKKTGEFYVTKNELKLRWDRDYHDPGFREIEKKLKGKDVKLIEEMADVFIGYSPKPLERLERGEYLIVGGRNIKDSFFIKTKKDKYINYIDTPSFERAILQPGDIIVSLLFKERKLYIYKESDPKAVLSSSCAIIHSPHNEYILTYLKTNEGQRLFLKQADRATGGEIIPRLSLKDLKNIKIPILPLDNLKKIAASEIKDSTTDELKELLAGLEEGKREKFDSLLDKFRREIIDNLENEISSKEVLYRIKGGETKKSEFKSTLRWNIKSKNFDKTIENGALKTIVAFCNSQGGELLIGVDDEGSILGIELDRFRNEDKFLLHLGNIITQRILQPVDEFVDYRIIDADYKRICQVICRKSTKPIWLKPEKEKDEQFFVRRGPSSKPLSPIRAIEYIKDHFEQ